MKAPCKGCEYREVACHVKCTDYLMYKKQMESQKENTIKRNDVLAYIGDNVRKVKTRMKKAKYGCTVNDQRGKYVYITR